MIPVTSLLFLTLITFVWIVHSTEYYIKNGAIPSYLHWQQQNSSSRNIFPNDIIVNVSMSRVTGTFVYSFDRNQNQLIVTMRDGLPHVMDIELNTQRISVSLPSICGCDRCRYEALELRIQIGYHIRVQCNGREVKIFKNEYTKNLNQKYPVLNTKQKRSLYSNNSDHLWLVNTPKYEHTYPNMYQLYGCIFGAFSDDKMITFTEITPNIDKKCIKTCTDNICNGGQCYETYSGAPICNCTSTFRNGPYCNNSFGSMNIQTYDSNIQTDSFKLSWNSSVNEIFEMRNNHTNIRFGVEASALILEYIRTSQRTAQSKVTLSKTYAPNKEYICILRFRKKHIDVSLLTDGSWINEIILTNHDLGREIFKSLILKSGDGIIDIVYKDNDEYQWRKFPIDGYTIITTTDTTTSVSDLTNGITTKATTTQSNTIIWILSIFLMLFIVGAVIAIIFVYCRKTKCANQQRSDGVYSEPLAVNENYNNSSLSSDPSLRGEVIDFSRRDVPPSNDNNNQTQNLI